MNGLGGTTTILIYKNKNNYDSFRFCRNGIN